ncbi:unnamed protein product [Auanema sp. JU1783]|nr:unnamed protein product [Auanema sp. JU1783]
MAGKLNGIVFVFLLFISSLLGSIFILFPFIPLAIYAPKLWRFFADRFVGYWLTFPASLIEFVFGCHFHVTGDLIKRDKPALIIMNHRTRLDWMFLWNALYKMDPFLLTTEKISLKAPLKKIPGAGWAMGCGSYIFLERSFESDKSTIESMMEYYAESNNTYQLLLFPEGTDRGERAMKLSNEFADKNGLPHYENVLHPRTTGFNYFIDLMQKHNYISYVYDVTLAYEDHVVESELQLLKEGKFPKNIHFDVKKYDISDLPATPDERSNWLTSLWKEKESRLKRFYDGDHKLEPSGERFVWPVLTRGLGYYVTFAFWIFSCILWLYLTYYYTLVKLYVLAAICFYIYALKKHNGVEFLILHWFLNYQQKSKSL